jgi:hypothetical protein
VAGLVARLVMMKGLVLCRLAGCDVPNESSLPLAQALNDTFRVNFYKGYIGNMAQAMKKGGEYHL